MKVGKALYTILGSSKKIQENFSFNTTDYAPSSTELVTNGDFSATGSELITNGDFSSETGWTPETGWTIADNKAFVNSTGTTALKQLSLNVEAGKTYKITGEIEGHKTGQLQIEFGAGTIAGYVSVDGVFTFYKKWNGNTTLYLYGISTPEFIIKNISLQEVGLSWTTGTQWNIEDNKATFTGTSDSEIIQTDVTTVNKHYKVSIQVLSNEGTGINSVYLGTNEINNTHLPVGVHTFYGQSLGNTILSVWGRANEDFNITNITVNEMVLTKIFPEIAPTGINAPYIVYSVVSNQPSESKEDNGAIDTASVEVYSFNSSYNAAIDLGVQVRTALKRVNGTYNTIEIQSINYTNEQMDVNEKRDLWASIQDYEIKIENK
tara:strand:+ start:184 stop:1314 length:1131 start_codon:yes stop_codon:yes gene_type:complete